MDGAENPFVGEMLRASRFHQCFEIDGPDQVGLDGTFANLTRINARLTRCFVENVPEHRRCQLTFRGSWRTRHEQVFTRQERKRELQKDVVALEKDALQFVKKNSE